MKAKIQKQLEEAQGLIISAIAEAKKLDPLLGAIEGAGFFRKEAVRVGGRPVTRPKTKITGMVDDEDEEIENDKDDEEEEDEEEID